MGMREDNTIAIADLLNIFTRHTGSRVVYDGSKVIVTNGYVVITDYLPCWEIPDYREFVRLAQIIQTLCAWRDGYTESLSHSHQEELNGLVATEYTRLIPTEPPTHNSGIAILALELFTGRRANLAPYLPADLPVEDIANRHMCTTT